MNNFINKYNTKEVIRRKNLSDILWYIVTKKQTTRKEIVRDTGFSWGQVSESVSLLLENGYVIEEGCVNYGVGRNTFLLKPDGGKVAAVGIDLNRTGVECIVTGFDGTVKFSRIIPFEAKTQEEAVSVLIDVCKLGVEYCKGKYKLFCIGISMQGQVDTINGVSEKFIGIDKWEPLNVPELIEREFGCYAVCKHDPECMLLSICASVVTENSLLIRADEGIGMAVMRNGHINDEFSSLEIGHTVAVYNGRKCVCGRNGCVEAYSSLRAITELTGKSADEVLDQPEKYSSVLDNAIKYLGTTIRNAQIMFCSNKLILTGQLFKNSYFAKKIIAELSDLGMERENVEILVLPNLSAAYGAALTAIEKTIKNGGVQINEKK